MSPVVRIETRRGAAEAPRGGPPPTIEMDIEPDQYVVGFQIRPSVLRNVVLGIDPPTLTWNWTAHVATIASVSA